MQCKITTSNNEIISYVLPPLRLSEVGKMDEFQSWNLKQFLYKLGKDRRPPGCYHEYLEQALGKVNQNTHMI